MPSLYQNTVIQLSKSYCKLTGDAATVLKFKPKLHIFLSKCFPTFLVLSLSLFLWVFHVAPFYRNNTDVLHQIGLSR